MLDSRNQPESETELERLFGAAHEQLLARDRELVDRGRQIVELLAATRSNVPADTLSKLADIRRDSLVYELQASLAEQAAWARRSADAVLERDHTIRELQAALARRTPWAERSAKTVLKRLGIIRPHEAWPWKAPARHD